jgi:predicted nucleic acid-binding protein
MRRYVDLPLDYADATLVVLAEDAETPHILTLDRRDFTVLRWRECHAFQIHPQ